MLGFTFNFSAVPKKQKKATTSSSSGKYEILNKGILGVVFIDLDAKYSVLTETEIKLPIVSENYSCKGVKDVYEQRFAINDLGHMNRVLHTRSERDRVECGKNHYLPFVAGCCVKGSIVLNKYTKVKMFKIRTVYVDNTNPLARNAIEFYRNNYNAIISARELNEQKDD